MTLITTQPHASPPAATVGEPIIEAVGLVKRYDGVTAVAGVDLTVAPSEIFGILGPNGAGKTTTLEMIEGLRPPDRGTIRVCGLDAVAQNDAVRRLIGVQLQTTALFDYLSAAELIELFAGLCGVDASRGRVDELLGLVGSEEKRGARAGQLSGGQRQRLSIALALVNRPRIAFLDEPTTGLDPRARRSLWETIQGIRATGTTVVLSTHSMEEAETLCDRVAIMDRGRVVICDSPAALVRRLEMDATVRATVSQGSLTPDELAALPAVVATDPTPGAADGAIALRTADAQATLIGLLALAERQGVTLAGLSSTQANLEDVFLTLTGRRYDVSEEGNGGSDDESRASTKRRRGRHG